jgi:hypothetical protein
MVTLGSVLLIGILVGLHVLVSAVTVRLLRVRLTTTWGPVTLALGIVPVLLILSTLVVGGVFQIGPDLGGQSVVLFVLVAVPLGLGFAVDYLWMPAPDEVELPDTLEK